MFFRALGYELAPNTNAFSSISNIFIFESSFINFINKEYTKRRLIAEKIFNELECTPKKEQVGLFVWGKIPNHIANGENYSDLILKKAKVFITPGFIFGSNGDNYLRISLCANEETLNTALLRIIEMKKIDTVVK